MGISHLIVPNFFFSELTFHVNKTFKTWGKSLQLPYANEAEFEPNMVYALVNDHQGLTFWVVAYGRFDCIVLLL